MVIDQISDYVLFLLIYAFFFSDNLEELDDETYDEEKSARTTDENRKLVLDFCTHTPKNSSANIGNLKIHKFVAKIAQFFRCEISLTK